MIQGLKWCSVVLKVKHWSWSWNKSMNLLVNTLKSSVLTHCELWLQALLGVSMTWKTIVQKLDLALYLCLVGFVFPLSILSLQYYPPLVTEGVRGQGSLGKDGKLEMHLKKCLLFIQWFIFGYTLESVWELGSRSLDLGRASKERMRKKYSLHHLNLVKILTLQAFPCVRSLCISLTGEAVTERWALLEPQPQQEQLGQKGSDSQEGKTLCLPKDLCSPPAVKAEVTCKPFLNWPGSSQVWIFAFSTFKHTWLSCVSKLDKWSSSDLGFNTNSEKCSE